MHRCLLISEVVVNIAQEILHDDFRWEKPTAWDSLAKLAQTCRMFSEPSLNLLWRAQASLIPLLRTMPADLWRMDDGILILDRPIKSTDWSRFQTYASRIHYLDRDSDEALHFPIDLCLSPEYLKALVFAKPSNVASFCPRMHCLNWDSLMEVNSEMAFECMPLFMGAATQEVTFSLDGLRTAGLSLAQSILYNFPGLRCITIQSDRRTNKPAVEDALTELVSHGMDLREVSVPNSPLPQPVAEHLAGFEHLQRLTVMVDERILSTQASGFRALKYLKVSSKTFRAIPSLVQMLISPLETAMFQVCDGVLEPQELARTFEMMKLHSLHPHLRSIRVSAFRSRVEPRGAVIGENVLQHLLVFSNLSDIRLYTTAPMELSNTIVQEMASAWPQLSLLILSEVGCFQGSSITLAGLIPLFCLPRINSISIAIGDSTIDPDATLAFSQTQEGTLRWLNLQDSIIDEIGPVAALLSKFAPNLEYIHSWNKTATDNARVDPQSAKEYRRRWTEVARLVPVIAAVRQEERAAVLAAVAS
ncbi:hypothetical protein HWV62_45112 [Athelia sp. TMB]|nr:hypothetical protein HWV62_45112 [Athelia sp. TMB]